jgi:hypothetical protein
LLNNLNVIHHKTKINRIYHEKSNRCPVIAVMLTLGLSNIASAQDQTKAQPLKPRLTVDSATQPADTAVAPAAATTETAPG